MAATPIPGGKYFDDKIRYFEGGLGDITGAQQEHHEIHGDDIQDYDSDKFVDEADAAESTVEIPDDLDEAEYEAPAPRPQRDDDELGM